jgi:hypothetical protein
VFLASKLVSGFWPPISLFYRWGNCQVCDFGALVIFAVITYISMGVWGSGCINPLFSWTLHWFEVSGQIHATAALPPGKEPPGTRWIGSWVGPRSGLDDVEKRKYLILPGLELRPLGRLARRHGIE